MLLECKNIHKTFAVKKGFLSQSKSYIKAVNNVSLSLPKGENLGLVGESGCGKSTLARMVLRLHPLSAGKILFEGKDISCASGKEIKIIRRKMQMVFQDPYSSLDPRFTVRSILKEAMTLEKVKYKTEQEKELRISELLKAVNLTTDMMNRYPHEFSGGERQRIAIARALVLNPKLLILDEAVSSLDVLIQEQILKLLSDLQKKFELTYLFITHNLRVVRKICQKIAVMYKGRIVELGSTEEIFHNPLHPYTKELLTAAMEYKTIQSEREITLKESARLLDQGNGHFVLED